jgi:hypothetical protein
MSKEQLELLDEAYENYSKKSESQFIPNFEDGTMTIISPASHYNFLSQEKFINKIKTDTEFAETWGLKIEERELSLEERIEITDNISKNIREDLYSFAFNNPLYVGDSGRSDDEQRHLILDEFDVPSKLITITYNDKTIEVFH